MADRPHMSLRPGALVDFVVQAHDADRAGPHKDVRLGTRETGLVSWASRKGLPVPGKPAMWVERPVHSHSHLGFEGEIPSGYGKGRVRRDELGRALVTGSGPRHLEFSIATGKHPRRYLLVRPPGWEAGRWLARETTPVPADKPPYVKAHYARASIDRAVEALRALPPHAVAQPKIDGASTLVTVPPNGRLELYSYREQARNGLPISHVEKVYGLGGEPRPRIELPAKLRDAVLRGELYLARPGGAAASPSALSATLNASLERSLRDRKRRGEEARIALFDVQRAGGRDVDWDRVPYEERWRLLKTFLPHLPGNFHLMPRVEGPDAALALWKRVREGEEPLTREGVVVHAPTGRPMKIKNDEDHDVVLTGTFPGEGRLRGLPGGFTYARPGAPKKEVGRIGSGLTDATRRAVAERPEDWIGRVARVRAHSVFPSGALRMPVYLALHEDQ